MKTSMRSMHKLGLAAILGASLAPAAEAKNCYDTAWTNYTLTRTVGDIQVSGVVSLLDTGLFKSSDGMPDPTVCDFSLSATWKGETQSVGRWNGALYLGNILANGSELLLDLEGGPNSGILFYPDNTGGTPGQVFWGAQVSGLFAGTYNEFAGFEDHEQFSAIDPDWPLPTNDQQLGQNYVTAPRYFVIARAPALPAEAVPEPATWAMMIGGLGLAGAAMRRRTGVQSALA